MGHNTKAGSRLFKLLRRDLRTLLLSLRVKGWIYPKQTSLGAEKGKNTVSGPAKPNHIKSPSEGGDFWPVIFSGQFVLFLWSDSALALVRAWSDIRECRKIPCFPEMQLWISGSPVQKSSDETLDSGDATLESGNATLDSVFL